MTHPMTADTPADDRPSVEEIEEAKALGKQATDQLASFWTVPSPRLRLERKQYEH